MSTGGGPSSQSGKKRKEFWEYSLEEVEEHGEEQVPHQITQGEEEYEEDIESESDSLDDDMEEEGTEWERNTGGEDDAGGSNTDGSQSRKRNRKPTKVGTIRQEFTAVTTVGVLSEPDVLRKGTVVKSRRFSETPS